MKVVSGDIMQKIDRRAIDEFGISGLTLMENAGRGCAEAILNGYGGLVNGPVLVIAGKGNNGGDGYVIARLLIEKGWQVTTFVVADRSDITGDARVNLELLDQMKVHFCPDQDNLGSLLPLIDNSVLIVDALLGTGLKSEVRGLYAEVIGVINGAGRPVVSVDIPSGVDAGSGAVLGCAVRAEMTVTFALAKLGHVLYPGAENTGRLVLVDIGIPADVTRSAEGFEFLDAEAVRPLIEKRTRSAHKGHFGHCLIIAGSTGKTGAAALAANSAVRTGAGLVTLVVPESLNHILEIKTTEAMTLPLPDDGKGYLTNLLARTITLALEGKSALAVGPGLSWNSGTADLVRTLVQSVELPLVIDADGLNALSDDPDLLLRKNTGTCILTPHPGEMARLAGVSTAEVERDRISMARNFAGRYQVCVVLKGARTVIASADGRIAINGSGNPGMASGGMGDVLTGILTALLGQGYDPFAACRIGVFLHGLAADMVAKKKGEIGISATDVQEMLPYAIKYILSEESC